MVDSHGEISKVAVRFYQQLLGEKSQVSTPDLDPLISLKLEYQEAEELGRNITAAEIKKALFSIHNEKSPGPDGFTALFFKDSWNVVGEDLITAVLSFFEDGVMPRYVNSIALTLIPKQKNAAEMRSFRPISCCNVVYKVASKVIANRLAKVLPALVSMNQTAFIKGRNISDGILLAHEMLSPYNRTKVSSRCAIQVDLMKAFDSVEWPFILGVLKAMAIPSNVIGWIEACFTSTMLSVNVNGSLCGYFPAKRGFRQGDPISPYLFVLSMEVLSCLFRKAVEERRFALHPQCKGIALTHLIFADDLLVFTKASTEAVDVVTDILEEFRRYSGLRFNPDKSQIYMAGVDETTAEEIVSRSGFCRGHLPFRYLGVPLTTGKLRSKDCRSLLDKITARIVDWKSKKLSYAGRVQLIESVVGGILQYWMSSFVLPSQLINDIEDLCNKFLWGKLDGGRVKVAWTHLAKPKTEGGIGLRDFKSWNVANVMKHIWNLLVQAGSLWIAWIKCYRIKKQTVWTVTSSCGSWHWKKLMKMRGCIKDHVTVDRDGDICWNGKVHQKLAVTEVWNTIRPKSSAVPWYQCVWSGHVIPKRSLIAWLIVTNRVYTRDKIKHWDPLVDAGCVFCDEEESRDHLFAECRLIAGLYSRGLPSIKSRTFVQTLEEISSWAMTEVTKAKLLIWRVIICRVWMERCHVIFRNSKVKDVQLIWEDIKEEIHSFALGNKDETVIMSCI
ncbi:LINE-1 retrotransposable element ORF2 protein [Linum perenne]